MYLAFVYQVILGFSICCSCAMVTVGNIYDDIDFLKREVENLQKNNEDAKKSYNGMKNSYDEMKNSYDAMKNSNTALKESNADLKKSNIALKKSYGDLKASNTDIRKSVDDLTKSNAKLTKSNAELKKSYDDLKKSNSELKKSNSDLKQSNVDLKNSYDHLQQSNDNLNESNSNLENTCEYLRQSNAVFIQNDNEFKQNIEKIQKESDAQEVSISKLKTAVAKQKISLAEVTIQSSKLSTFCQSLPKNVCGDCTCLDDSTLPRRYYCDCQHIASKRDCVDFYSAGNTVSGIYRVTLNLNQSIQVYCEQGKDAGGWTVIQRRFDNSTNFYRNWTEYKMGFGSLQREFWMGNDLMYLLTLQAAYPKGSELRIDMEDWQGNSFYSKFSTIFFDNEKRDYAIRVSGSSGTGGSSLTNQNNQRFSTYDRGYYDCAYNWRGAWWHRNCGTHSNLNGEYFSYDTSIPYSTRGLTWYYYQDDWRSMKKVEMKVRRKI